MILWSISEKIRMRGLLRRFYRIDVRGAEEMKVRPLAGDYGEVVVAVSFNSTPNMNLHASFSLRWYQQIATDPLVVAAFGRTALAAVCTAVSTIGCSSTTPAGT